MTERFELLEQIGKGGMGTVWKARDTETGEVVALKLLHEQYADDPYFLERFEREVEVTRRVQSSHVVRMVGYGVREGRPYVAMEYVDGRTLREILRERGKLDWPEAKALLWQVALGLGAAHAVGVVHRDVKPSNILVTPEGEAKLADFGIAKAADLTALTGTHTMLGTTGYMAPEGKATPQADLYALGCVAYEMLTGAPPFEGETPAEVLVKHIRETPDLSKASEGARSLVGWLLEKEASARPASAEVLVGMLDGSTGGSIRRSVTATGGRGGRVSRRKAALLGGMPLLLLLAGAGAAFVLSGGSDPTEPTDADATPKPGAISDSVGTATPSLTSSETPTTATPTPTPVPPTPTRVIPTAPTAYSLTLDLNDLPDGHTFTIGQGVSLCYWLTPSNVPYGVRLFTSTNGSQHGLISQWTDTGGGDCIDSTVGSPAGTRTYLAQSVVNGSVVAEDTTFIEVVVAGGGGDPPPTPTPTLTATPTSTPTPRPVQVLLGEHSDIDLDGYCQSLGYGFHYISWPDFSDGCAGGQGNVGFSRLGACSWAFPNASEVTQVGAGSNWSCWGTPH